MNENILGFGTAAIGRPQYINIRQGEQTIVSLEEFKHQGIKMLNAAYNQGIRYFDTAPGYGMAEQLLLDWLDKKCDSTIKVATKWGYTYTANYDPNAVIHEIKNHTVSKLNEQWSTSKKLLPYLNVYQIHSATLDSGVLSDLSVLHRMAEIKSKHGVLIGITSSGANQNDIVSKALELEVNGLPLFDIFQCTYNIFDQSLSSLIPRLKKSNKLLVVKEALANGRVFKNPTYDHYQSAYNLLAKLAKKYHVGVDAIALRFCIDSLQPYKVLSGASNTQHLSDNIAANTFQLEAFELDLLKNVAVSSLAYWAERKLLKWN